MAASIEASGVISLNGYQYRLLGPIKSVLANNWADKIVIGDVNADAHLDVSYLRWDDWTEGIGLEEFHQATSHQAPKRAWWSTCDLSNVGHLTLGPLATEIEQPTDGTPTALDTNSNYPMITFRNNVYSMFLNTIGGTLNHRIYKYDGSTTWGSALHAMGDFGNFLGQARRDAAVGHIGGTEHIVFSAQYTYAYSTDGTTWNDSTTNAERIAIWDDRLWGVDHLGQAWYATSPGTETYVATVPIAKGPDFSGTPTAPSYITDLFTMRWIDNKEYLFVATAFGIFFYDIDNDRWVKTEFTYGQNRMNGIACQVWNGDFYIPTGLGLNRAILGSTINVLQVGPDRDHGLPTEYIGAIGSAAAGLNFLALGLRGRATDFNPFVTDVSTNYGSVLAYDGKGMQVIWASPNADEYVTDLMVSNAYNAYRLWFRTVSNNSGRGQNTFYVPLPSGRTNDNQVQSKSYAASSILISPWYKVGEDVTGIALSTLVEVDNTSANETVKVEYAVNFSSSYTTLGTITNSDGVTEYAMPNSTSPTGVSFYAIRFRLTLARGATTTNTPHVNSLTLKFLKKLPSRWHHQVTLDISGYNNQSARQQWTNLRTAIDNGTLVEFTYGDDSASTSAERFWVQVRVPETEEEGGLEYGGKATLILVEPQHLQ